MLKYIYFAVTASLFALIISCTKEEPKGSKIWAHRVNDIATAQLKEDLFDGMELDIIYSDYQNELFVGHDMGDTINRLTFDEWLSSLKHPKKSHFWIDMKNLSYENADSIASKILFLSKKYDIKDKVIVESSNRSALEIIKKHDLSILLWVDNFLWSGLDTVSWKKKVEQDIELLKPDAISAAANIFPILSNTFPNSTIYYWNTPTGNYEKNVELTKAICRTPNVKVVLVDYDEPIEY